MVAYCMARMHRGEAAVDTDAWHICQIPIGQDPVCLVRTLSFSLELKRLKKYRTAFRITQ